MNHATRWMGGLPLAGAATGGLFLLMVGLVRAEFAPQAKAEVREIALAPMVEDIAAVRRKAVMEPLQRVETPPPPPRITTVVADAPSVPVAVAGGEIPVFDPVEIDPGQVSVVVPDRDVQPLVRIPPVMPAGAERSGHCEVTFDVSPDGSPFNVRATACSDRVFRRATERSVAQWKFQPRLVDGLAVGREGVRNVVRFNLVDERGELIPER